MSDEALDKHLQWLEHCAKEQDMDYESWLESRVAHLEAENVALKRELADEKQRNRSLETTPLHDNYKALKRKIDEIGKWKGCMHAPAYGEWNERGWWQRGGHIFGTPQIENMCREILALLTAEEPE